MSGETFEGFRDPGRQTGDQDPLDIQRRLDEDKIDLWHGATGVATEAGELLDAAKKLRLNPRA